MKQYLTVITSCCSLLDRCLHSKKKVRYEQMALYTNRTDTCLVGCHSFMHTAGGNDLINKSHDNRNDKT